ncbi:MAG: hypothetical protein JWM40_129, partial [Frankiales bacterium]|nr:hypothetical protein [Frankiales bacterium]
FSARLASQDVLKELRPMLSAYLR